MCCLGYGNWRGIAEIQNPYVKAWNRKCALTFFHTGENQLGLNLVHTELMTKCASLNSVLNSSKFPVAYLIFGVACISINLNIQEARWYPGYELKVSSEANQAISTDLNHHYQSGWLGILAKSGSVVRPRNHNDFLVDFAERFKVGVEGAVGGSHEQHSVRCSQSLQEFGEHLFQSFWARLQHIHVNTRRKELLRKSGECSVSAFACVGLC